jgi:hypothetical protein
MLMTLTCLMAGLTNPNWEIFAADVGLFVMAIFIAPEIKKAMRNKASKELLSLESPLNWLKSSTLFFVLSTLSSLGYGIIDVSNIGVESNQTVGYLIGDLFIFSVVLFILGLLFTFRIIWFIIDPASKSNILAGKLLKTVIFVGVRGIFAICIIFFQLINGLMLGLILNLIFVSHEAVNPFVFVYLPTLVLSFIAVIPFLYRTVFHFDEKNRIRDWAIVFCYFSPWIVVIPYNLLLKL